MRRLQTARGGGWLQRERLIEFMIGLAKNNN